MHPSNHESWIMIHYEKKQKIHVTVEWQWETMDDACCAVHNDVAGAMYTGMAQRQLNSDSSAPGQFNSNSSTPRQSNSQC